MGHHRRQRVVLLNGPAGIGKTTVGRLVAASARNGAIVHGDDLKKFIAARVDGEVETGLSYVGGATLAAVYLNAGYDLVVFDFVFERPRHVERFTGAFTADVPVHVVTLWAPLQVVMERELTRPGRRPLGSRVEECWRAMRAELSGLGAVVDATGSPSEVAESVLRSVTNGTGLQPTRRG